MSDSRLYIRLGSLDQLRMAPKLRFDLGLGLGLEEVFVIDSKR